MKMKSEESRETSWIPGESLYEYSFADSGPSLSQIPINVVGLGSFALSLSNFISGNLVFGFLSLLPAALIVGWEILSYRRGKEDKEIAKKVTSSRVKDFILRKYGLSISESIVTVFQYDPYFYSGEVRGVDLDGNEIFVRIHADEDHSSLRVTHNDENLPVLDSYKEIIEEYRLSHIS